MGLFGKKKRSTDELYEDLSRLEVEEQVVNKESNVAEKEDAIRKLKQQYGPNWRKILGVNGSTDVASLRSFLRTANKGIRGAASSNERSGSFLSPLPSSRLNLPISPMRSNSIDARPNKTI